MNFQLDDFQLEAQHALRRYLEAEAAPVVDEYEAQKKPVPRHLIQAMREYGLLGGLLPEELGGFGLPMVTYGTLIAEVARVWPSLRSITSSTNLAASVLADGGSPALKEKYLPRILSGEFIASFALSEPNIGSDAANVETRAERTADGYRVNGRKLYISNGPICDMGVVFVRTQSDEGKPEVSCLLYESAMPGFSVSDLGKMGMHSCPLGELLFEDVQVPAGNLVGKPGRGFSLAKKYLNVGRCVVAFSALGVAEVAYEAAVRYAKDRVQFGRPIGSFQLVQQMVADMMALVETSRLLCYRAADALDRNAPDSHLLCSMAKRHATDAALRVAELSLQVHGGAGYTTLFPVERYYRDVRHLTIAEGTNQIQSMLMAQHALELSAMR
ncbi:acyl-CoA dehydrogenase family protein [Cupriavidus oxalaticus]|uniref:Acyl-CoA dehydrogenase n=1 Tax=Cupriavidus oxalaticus TaxID=96344 RepID=A0A5P3VSD0_9BURK|nr:acyl-CoA dehydrogenase family protein [Cupriavidus oxalaticus]QEZ48918.1 acyl-CoA dehydrogenase [Cupriavidus oxalaticus]